MKSSNIILFLNILSSFKYCKTQEMEGRIVGGSYAQIIHFPHSVFLHAICETEWTCGASILNQRVVLTAAHCIYGCDMDENYDIINIYAGNEDLRQITVKIKAVGYKSHEHYNDQLLENDIGVIVLGRNLPFSLKIRRIILALPFPWNVRNAMVAGWGCVDEDTLETTNILKSVNQKLRDRETCRKIGSLTKGMFCAGSLDGNQDRAAQGDSGSALVVNGHIQIGLVSFKTLAYRALMVYTNVTYYYKWITNTAQEVYCTSFSKKYIWD